MKNRPLVGLLLLTIVKCTSIIFDCILRNVWGLIGATSQMTATHNHLGSSAISLDEVLIVQEARTWSIIKEHYVVVCQSHHYLLILFPIHFAPSNG